MYKSRVSKLSIQIICQLSVITKEPERAVRRYCCLVSQLTLCVAWAKFACQLLYTQYVCPTVSKSPGSTLPVCTCTYIQQGVAWYWNDIVEAHCQVVELETGWISEQFTPFQMVLKCWQHLVALRCVTWGDGIADNGHIPPPFHSSHVKGGGIVWFATGMTQCTAYNK